MTARPRCGNDPRAQLTPGDRAAVANFRAFLTARTEEKTTVSELDDARAALTLFLTTKYHIRIDRFEAAVRANERASSEARRLGAPDAVPAPSAAIRRKLRRWAYAAGHIESELADAVDRMYAAIAGDIAGQQPATGRADLRQRIAAALYAHDHPGWLLPLHESDVEPVYQGRAAAVLPVLPAPADQVTGLLRRAEAYLSALHGSVARHDNLAANLACAGCELRDQIRAELQRAADEEPQPAVTVHAVPLPGSNGISSCCGRPPCEFVGERMTLSPDAVTCTGHAAAAGEPEDEGDYAQPDPPIRCALPEQSGPAAEATP